MSDLISRSALKEEMVKDLAVSIYMSEMRKTDIAIRVLNKIDEAPAVDAVPVVHARWEYIEDYAYSRIGWHCTSCRKRIPNEMVAFAKYCPNCCAKMDGGAEA